MTSELNTFEIRADRCRISSFVLSKDLFIIRRVVSVVYGYARVSTTGQSGYTGTCSAARQNGGHS